MIGALKAFDLSILPNLSVRIQNLNDWFSLEKQIGKKHSFLIEREDEWWK